MKCNRCGMDLENGWNFCPTCKSEIVNVDLSSFEGLNIKPIKGFCNKCAFELKDNWNFCPRCSSSIDFYVNEPEPLISNNGKSKSKLSIKDIFLRGFVVVCTFPFNYLFSFLLMFIYVFILKTFFSNDGLSLFNMIMLFPSIFLFVSIGLSILNIIIFIVSFVKVYIKKNNETFWKVIFVLNFIGLLLSFLFNSLVNK